MSDKLDGLFMTAVQQSQGIDNFMDNLFSFFARKTDFYSKEENALMIVNNYLTKHIKSFQEKVAKNEAIEKQRKAAAQKAEAERAAKTVEIDDSQTMEVSAEEAALIEAQEAAKKANPSAATAAAEKMASEEAKEEGKTGEEEKDEGEVPNAANGGSTDKYTWEQTLQELTVNIVIPEGTTSKMLTVDIAKTHLKVGLKGQPLMIDGALSKMVKKGDSIWCLETDKSGQRILQISLTKKD